MQIKKRIKIITVIVLCVAICSCGENQNTIKRKFNKDLGGYFLQEIDYTDRMKISEIDGIYFCVLDEDSRIFAKKKNDLNRYYIIHGVNTKKQFLKHKDAIFEFETENNIFIDDIIFDDNQFYLTINDSNNLVLPDTVLKFNF